MEDELDMETQLERELAAEQEELLDEEEVNEDSLNTRPGLSKVRSLPSNFIYNPPAEKGSYKDGEIGSAIPASFKNRTNNKQ